MPPTWPDRWSGPAERITVGAASAPLTARARRRRCRVTVFGPCPADIGVGGLSDQGNEHGSLRASTTDHLAVLRWLEPADDPIVVIGTPAPARDGPLPARAAGGGDGDFW